MYACDATDIETRCRALAPSDGPSVGLSIRPESLHHGAIDIAWRLDMETLFVWIVVIAALIALDAGALRWGVDSRDPLPDDHRR